MPRPLAQIARLRKVPGITPARYHEVVIRGEPSRSNRASVASSGAVLPAGSTDFLVPDGTLAVGDIVRWRSQHFHVDGLIFQPPFYRTVIAETRQVPGRYPVIVPQRVTYDGTLITYGEDGIITYETEAPNG